MNASSIFGIIFIIGATQGVFLVISITARKRFLLPEKILVVLLGAFSLNLLNVAAAEFGLHRTYPHLLFLTHPYSLLFAPLLYLYVAAITGHIKKIRGLNLLHFTPFLLDILRLLPFYTTGAQQKLTYTIETGRAVGIFGISPLFFTVVEIAQYAVYIAISFSLINKHNRDIRRYFSEITRFDLAWLRIVLVIDLITISIIAVFVALQFAGLHILRPMVTRTSFLISTVLLYVIGFYSMKRPDIADASETVVEHTPEIEPIVTTASENNNAQKTKYEKSGISDDVIQLYRNQLIAFMEEKKPYLDEQLNLGDLAEQLSMSKHHLSQVINRGTGNNFYTFINTYRVNEVKQLLKTPEYADENILSVAYEAGFKSKSSFNTAFRKITGTTPSLYKHTLHSDSER